MNSSYNNRRCCAFEIRRKLNYVSAVSSLSNSLNLVNLDLYICYLFIHLFNIAKRITTFASYARLKEQQSNENVEIYIKQQ